MTFPPSRAWVLLLACLVGGCASEVDKCVEAQVSAWKQEQARIEADIASGKAQPVTASNDLGRVLEIAQGKVLRDTRSREEVAAQARLRCMQAAGKPQ
jgi:hypothetical protein